MLSGVTDYLVIKGFQAARLFEHDVCCTLNLPDFPCVAKAKCFRDRTIAFCENVQDFMEALGVDSVREFLSSLNI